MEREDEPEKPVYDMPSDVSVHDGVVHAKGPDGVDIDLTPTAAAEIAERLLLAAVKAEGETEMNRHNGRD